MTRKMKPFGKTASAAVCIAVACASPALADRPGFESPSGNIMCYFENSFDGAMPFFERPVVCLVFEADWPMPVGSGEACDVEQTRLITLPPSGPATETAACHGDVFWPVLGAIGYGSEWTIANFTCQMARTGVSCQNGTGHAFSASRAARTLN